MYLRLLLSAFLFFTASGAFAQNCSNYSLPGGTIGGLGADGISVADYADVDANGDPIPSAAQLVLCKDNAENQCAQGLARTTNVYTNRCDDFCISKNCDYIASIPAVSCSDATVTSDQDGTSCASAVSANPSCTCTSYIP